MGVSGVFVTKEATERTENETRAIIITIIPSGCIIIAISVLNALSVSKMAVLRCTVATTDTVVAPTRISLRFTRRTTRRQSSRRSCRGTQFAYHVRPSDARFENISTKNLPCRFPRAVFYPFSRQLPRRFCVLVFARKFTSPEVFANSRPRLSGSPAR